MENKPSEIVIHQAAQWYARLHAPDCSEADSAAFKAWLGGDPTREQAYRSVIDAARLVSTELGADPRMRALAVEALNQPQDAPLRPAVQRLRYASAAAILVGIALFFSFGGGDQPFNSNPTQSYTNNELSKQRIELSDGSVVYLDAGAQLKVAMSAGERRLDLEAGRAFFEVAHDKSRPFSVGNSATRVVALGTRFQVDVGSSDQAVNIILVEGSVAVTNSSEADTWQEVLRPGQQLTVDNLLHRHKIVSVNVNAVTSWSTGFLVFDGMPLHKVLDEINRYTKVKVLLGDSSLANIPVAGSFIAGGDSNEFVETLTTVLPLKSALTGANEIALFRKYGSDNN